MVAPTGDPKEIVVEGEWLHALEYLRRLDKKNVIGDKWQGHNVWFFSVWFRRTLSSRSCRRSPCASTPTAC